MAAARQHAEARTRRGYKSISFDPMCNFSGGKASEWVPIIPGTDGAVVLAMCNVIVNELGIWDDTYLKTKDALEPVSPDELLWRSRQGLVTVLDVRPPEEYAAGHVPGAVNTSYGRDGWRVRGRLGTPGMFPAATDESEPAD